MKTSFRVDLGVPALLSFSGPDAVRFLNGQITQDVKRCIDTSVSLPACITDAKGKLQFRVFLTECPDHSLWISSVEHDAEAIEARLTRYLIADDVEVGILTGKYHLHHLVGAAIPATGNAFARKASRFGVEGMDLWIPAGEEIQFPEILETVTVDELEAFRIFHGAPAWGKELGEGMLPPEAGLDLTDISYHKGCYIGQEVISRIKSAGKVNRSMLLMMMPSAVPAKDGDELFSDGAPAGFLTSVSPIAESDLRDGLALVKRTADRGNLQVKCGDGEFYDVKMRC